MEKPKQAHFYIPPTLRASCETIFQQQGLSFSEGLVRLVKLLLSASDDLKPLILDQIPGKNGRIALAREVLKTEGAMGSRAKFDKDTDAVNSPKEAPPTSGSSKRKKQQTV